MFKFSALFFAVSVMGVQILEAGPVEKAQTHVDAVINYLNELEKEVEFPDDASELKFIKTQREMDQLKAQLIEIEKIVSQSGEIEEILDQADFVRELMAAYMAPADFPRGSFVLSRPDPNAVNVDIDADVILQDIAKELGFLDIVNGRIRIRSGKNYVGEFSKLKTKYHGLITKAWAIDPQDKRVRALIDWGKNTNVKASKDDPGFGQSIISFSDF